MSHQLLACDDLSLKVMFWLRPNFGPVVAELFESITWKQNKVKKYVKFISRTAEPELQHDQIVR